jgi:hypothetical protein
VGGSKRAHAFSCLASESKTKGKAGRFSLTGEQLAPFISNPQCLWKKQLTIVAEKKQLALDRPLSYSSKDA